MRVGEALDFARTHHRGVIATTRQDGSTQMSPVVAAVDGSGAVVVSTRETAMKTAHVRRTGRAALLLMSDTFFGPWIQVEGSAEVVSLPDAMDGLVAYYRSISGEHPDWDDYRSSMERDRRVLLRITVERAGPDTQG
ncbi:MAG TPA: PPOX class F420-dependent oxidoreductase [Acidimicrobiales bacterium]|nr:PPOX class F420-dependent oxidoreductase [Acidimicrobiales bacterium]